MTEADEVAVHGRRTRLDQLLRRHHGRHRRQQLEALLGRCSPTSWEVVPPPASDPVVARLVEAVRAARAAGRLDLDVGLSATAFSAAIDRALGAEPNGTRVTLAVSDTSQVGVIEAEGDLARACARSILDLDRDSLIITDTHLRWGVVCQRFEEAQGVTYQIESWR